MEFSVLDLRSIFNHQITSSPKSLSLSTEGFNDTGELWRENYEVDDFEQQLEEQLQKIQPLYKLLHAYVRRKLRAVYGPERILEDGPIPAHILGEFIFSGLLGSTDLLSLSFIGFR